MDKYNKVGNCGLRAYQIVTFLKRATSIEITTITTNLISIISGSLFFYLFYLL